MKRLSAVFFILFLTTTTFSQSSGVKDFVIDQSKPYVYLKFDHIGPREPLEKGEGNGLWLRVVNNCRIPIVFRSQGMPDDERGVVLEDEVVAEPMLVISNRTPEEVEATERERLRKLKHKPDGYSFEVSGVARVQPGQDLLFSFPLNHVDEEWYMRVKFALDLNKSSASLGPYTYLSFHEWDIPKDQRLTKTTQ